MEGMAGGRHGEGACLPVAVAFSCCNSLSNANPG